MDTDVPDRRPLLVTSNVAQAESWTATLQDAGVDALIEITDAQTGDPARSPLIGILGVRPPEFVYLVTLPPRQRDLAVSALVDAGWDGREGLRGGRGTLGPGESSVRQLAVAGVLSALGIALFILIRVATG